jgi:predicted sulfurtransferase
LLCLFAAAPLGLQLLPLLLQSKRVVVMDLRNDYEWDAGHFDWAPRPDEEVFAGERVKWCKQACFGA